MNMHIYLLYLLYLTLARCSSLGSTHTTAAPDRSAASVLVPASVTRDMRAMWNWRLWDLTLK